VKTILKRIAGEDQGVLTFEWILLITVVVIGIVGGLSAVRDALVSELGDVSGAVVAVDQSFTVEMSECDPCEMDFGSYTDEPLEVLIERPDEPPVSQSDLPVEDPA